MPRRAAQPKATGPVLAAVAPKAKAGRTAKAARAAHAPDAAPLHEATTRLHRLAESLDKALAEIPRAADFEPLAEHLYEFARQAPALGASLQELPKVAEPLARSVKALQNISETLEHANHSFGEALLRLPRPEDYEPLAEPLREFARVSPALAEAMREVLAVASPLATLAAPLAESVRGLATVAARLEATGKSLEVASLAVQAGPPPAVGDRADRVADDELRERVESAHEAILEALAGLPRTSDYEPAAAQLRAIASVSPSLLDWLGEVPALAAPLTESVRALQKAAADLKAARALFPSR
jgi:ABC-type transporter Mla subunit MlaD